MGGCWYLSCYRQRPRKHWASSSPSEVLKWYQHGNRYYLRYVKTPCKKRCECLICWFVIIWFSLCLISVFVHVLTCMRNAFLLSVCQCHKFGDEHVLNEKGWKHNRVPHFGGSFIIWRTSERANLSETPALNCTTKTKLQPFISAMIRLAHDSTISSLDILGSSRVGDLVGGPSSQLFGLLAGFSEIDVTLT